MALPAGSKTASNNLKLDSNDRLLMSSGTGAKPSGSVGIPGELYADSDGRLLVNGGETIFSPSGGDDTVALQALIADGADILLGPGTFLWNTAPVSIPKSLNGIRIRGSGIGVTTIKLSTAAKRAFDLVRTADYDVFQNIEISDLTVDANNVASTTNQHVLLGNLIDSSWGQRLNFQNIRVRRCRTINVPAANTDGDGSSTTGSRQSVSLVSKHLGTGEATRTSIKDILIQDCDFSGGVGVALLGSGSNSGVNVLIDRVAIDGLKHDTGVTPTAPPASPSHCAYQIGGNGFGGSCTVTRVRSYNSNDVGGEIDSMTYAHVSDVITEDSWTVGQLARNFATPLDASAQRYVYHDCHHRVININPPATTLYTGNSYGWFLSGTSSPPTLKSVSLVDCSHYSKATNLRVSGEAICAPDVPFEHLATYNFNAVHEGVNDSTASPAPSWGFFRIASSVTNQVEWHGGRCWIDGTYSAAAATFRLLLLGGAGPTLLAGEAPIFKNTLTCTGTAIYLIWFGRGPGSANAVISGRLSGGGIESWTGTNGNGYGFEGSAALTTDRIDIDGFNLKNFPGNSDTVFGAPSNASKVFLRNIRWRVYPAPPTTNNSKFVSGTFTTATANQYVGGQPARVSVSGGAGVTAIDTSVDGTTYVNKLTQAAAAIPQPVNFILNNAEYLKLTFTTTAPTVSVEPLP